MCISLGIGKDSMHILCFIINLFYIFLTKNHIEEKK